MSTESIAIDAASPRSTFVSVVAWIFIVGASWLVCISLLQAIMVMFVVPFEPFLSIRRMPPEFQQMPGLVRLVFQNPLSVFVLTWSLATLTLVAAIGLLRRKNWARVTFIGLMTLAICGSVGGLWLQQAMLSSFPRGSVNVPSKFTADVEAIATVVKVGSAVIVAGLSALFAWIIKKLTSPGIRAEFNALTRR